MASNLVSIIIPLHNSKATVGRAIESVLNQTYAHRELIIIDGASTDGSMDIVKSYNGRLAYKISEPDSGVYEAINKGLAQCKGEWIYILGADDYLAAHDVLEKVFSNLPNACKIIFGNVKNEDAKNRFVTSLHENTFDSRLVYKNTLHQQGVFYHNSIFAQFKFDQTLKVLADYDLHLKLYNEEVKGHKVNFTIANCDAQGLSKSFSINLYKEELRIKRRRLNWLLYLANIPLAIAKYAVKNTLG
jgi:putative colanic acid biosynthesis glycosyltransferase